MAVAVKTITVANPSPIQSSQRLVLISKINMTAISAMSLIPEDWFEQILSKINGSSFNKKEIPDRLSASIFNDDKEIAHWDLTEEIKQNGIARIKFTNTTLNVDVQFLFMHEDLKNKLADDELFQNIMDQVKNNSDGFDFNANVTFHYEQNEGYESLIFMQGTFTLLVGLIGLLVKLKGTRRPKVVKVTGYAYSIWCIITGILMLVEHITRPGLESTTKTLVFLISAVSSVLLKVLLISFKLFTIVVYTFQNTMIYRPFFFRRNKKTLSRWVLRISAGQSAGVFIVLIAWSIVLVFNNEDGDCHDVIDRTHEWQLSVRSLIWGGYLGSLFLSLIFTVGFYRKSAKKIGGSERKGIKKTMIASSVEILFDVSALIAFMLNQYRCIKLVDLVTLNNFAMRCDITGRFDAIGGVVPDCVFKGLAMQPTIQEIFVLLTEIIEYCSK